MTSTPFDIGDTVRLSAVFTNMEDAPADPTVVTLRIRKPDGTITVLTYAAAQITRDGLGEFHYDYPIAVSGDHYYRYEGTGNVATASETFFRVNKSKIVG